MTSLAELNRLPAGRAAELLAACCGSARWVEALLARRPFASREQLVALGSEVWRSLSPEDWKEAFARHPRIGERSAARAQNAVGAGWSRGEQSGMDAAGEQLRRELAEANRAYEERFGYTYIVCATGKSAEQMLSLARSRLKNDPATELEVAACEQEKIMMLRLEKLLADSR